jgi:uncharacterized delta-60 repeat protein
MFAFRSRQKRSTAPARRHSSAYRPRLEVLEDRCLLSAGVLDPTFGAGGIVTTSPGAAQDHASAMALQTDGKIVVVGSTSDVYDAQAENFLVARYNANGALDAAFGSGGLTITAIDSRKEDAAQAVAIDYSGTPQTNPNYGKIYVAGYVNVGKGLTSNDYAFVLVRYNSNGALDTTFGGNKAKGKVITDFSSSGDLAYGIAIQADGKIIVSGWGNHDGGTYEMARYKPDGTLDSTFGASGKVTTTGVNAFERGRIALQSDGKIVAVWSSSLGGGSHVARYNTNGSLDSSFGANGLVTVVDSNSNSEYSLRALTIQADGKIVVAGYTVSYGNPDRYYIGAFFRFDTNGTLDPSFGAAGSLLSDGIDLVNSVATDDAGRIVAAGDTWTGAFGSTDGPTVSLVRLNGDGSADGTFGTGGQVLTWLSPYSQYAYAVAIQPDGDIVIAGNVYTTGGPNKDSDLLVARYLSAEPVIDSFTASATKVTSGSNVTLTASAISDANPNSTITQVEFYYFDGNGARITLGYGSQSQPGAWTLTFAVTLDPGLYTVYAQAKDNYGVLGDSLDLALTVQ